MNHNTAFRALLVTETNGDIKREIATRKVSDLPDGDLTIRVKYSSLNYKDALSATGHKGVTKNYPHTPGVDAAGVVAASDDARFKEGDEVIVTSYDLGVNTNGGFGQYIRVPADWAVSLPNGLSLREAMILGSAGFTAGMSLHALQHQGVLPDDGEVVVTGASGGVGSTSIAVLARAGYEAVAATGQTDRKEFFTTLGARRLIGREEVDDSSGKPLLKGLWAGGIDAVGGNILATVIKSIKRGGAVAATGLTKSAELNTTVYPFILRGVSLLGIDSAECPMPHRRAIWQRLATDWKPDCLEAIAEDVSLDDLNPKIDAILEGGTVGRVVVNLD